MATSITDTSEFVLQDDTEVTVRPLNIKKLRKFMAVVSEIPKVEDDDQDAQLDIMLRASAIVLDGKVSVPEGEDPYQERLIEHLSELLDLPTMNAIMEAAGGISMGGSPNLTAAG